LPPYGLRAGCLMTLVTYDVSGVSGSHTWTDRKGPPEPLPTREYIDACIDRVQEDRLLQLALRHERGLNRKAASRYGIGYDPDKLAWVLPIIDADGFLVNVTWRPHRGEEMIWKGKRRDRPIRIAGRKAHMGMLPLYPFVPQQGPILLAGGEWDALACNFHRLPAVCGLLGCHWHSAWNRAVEGRRVAVCLDVGEEEAAERIVLKLREAGARKAWVVPLPLPNYGDDLEAWFRPRQHGGYGKGRAELIELIREARAK
jgi:hypothetical protein